MTATDRTGATSIDLVTGGAGFLGAHLVRLLHACGRRVRVLDPITPDVATPCDEFIEGSITEFDTVSRAMQGVGRVFHLAALAELWIPDRTEYLRVNHEGTRHVLRAAAEEGVESVVHCSSEALLAPDADGGTVDEDARPTLAQMPGPYPRSKLMAEREAVAAAEAGQRVIIVSPAVPIGPGDRYLTPPARMLLGFLNGDYPAYLETVLNLVDVRDVATAHLHAAEQGASGRRYVLGGTSLRFSELLHQLEALTGLSMPRRRVPYWLAYVAALVGELRADYVTHCAPAAPLTGVRLARIGGRCDNARARAELGVDFRPLAESLRASIVDFEQRGLLHRRPEPSRIASS